MSLEIRVNLQDAFAQLQKVEAQSKGCVRNALTRIAKLVHNTAREYAPISPTQADVRTDILSRGFTQKQAANKMKRRNPLATSGRKPGTLQHSIQYRVESDNAMIFVPLSSGAGRYAFRIHEEKGLTWFKRGLGTVAKGFQADAKFITRAIAHNANDALTVLNDEHRKATGVDLRRPGG